MKNDKNRKDGENAKIVKNGKNKWGRLRRYMNRTEPGKKVLNSWDQDLSIDDLEGPSGYRKNVKMVSMFFDFGPPWRRHVVNSKIFDVLRAGMALKAQISSSKIDFGSKFCQKHFFDIFSIFWFSKNFVFEFFQFCHFSDFHDF